VPSTPPATLQRARRIAMGNGVHYAYTGNVVDHAGDTTVCPSCGTEVIVRNWYELLAYRLDDTGHCLSCKTQIPGVFEGPAGTWGRKRQPVRLEAVGR